jgi:hypothetical protein
LIKPTNCRRLLKFTEIPASIVFMPSKTSSQTAVAHAASSSPVTSLAGDLCEASACEVSLHDEVESCELHTDVAAYLDGELDGIAARNFERHLAGCACCRAHLNDQRRVLTALEGAFGVSRDVCDIELPESYARVVAARAKADIATLRTPRERRHALSLGIALSFATFVVLGATASAKVYEYTGIVARTLVSLVRLSAETAGDFLVGASVLLRAVGESVPAGLRVAPIVLCAVFFLALALLLRLIASYRREEFNPVQYESRCE